MSLTVSINTCKKYKYALIFIDLKNPILLMLVLNSTILVVSLDATTYYGE